MNQFCRAHLLAPDATTSVPHTFIDVFAGCGGLSLGLMQAGWKGLFAIEQDTNAFATLSANLIGAGQEFRYVWPDWLPKKPTDIASFLKAYAGPLQATASGVDMLVGGPPCQGYSSAGRRRIDDPRNHLFEAYLTLVGLLQPKIVLIENVKGMTQRFSQPEAGVDVNYSEKILDRLSPSYQTYTRLIDVSGFGVPQRRVRFFVIGIRRDIAESWRYDPFDELELARISFARSKGLGPLPVTAATAISDLELRRNRTCASMETRGFQEMVYGRPLTSYQRLMHAGHEGRVSDTRLARHSAEIVSRFSQIIELCRAQGRLNVSLSGELRAAFGLRKRAIRVLDPDAPAPTVTSMPDDLIHYSEPRALTVRENARLQSFPDWFSFQGKYTTGGMRRRMEVPRFTQVANAVPPLMAEAIGRVLLKRARTSEKEAAQLHLPESRTAPGAQAA